MAEFKATVRSLFNFPFDAEFSVSFECKRCAPCGMDWLWRQPPGASGWVQCGVARLGGPLGSGKGGCCKRSMLHDGVTT